MDGFGATIGFYLEKAIFLYCTFVLSVYFIQGFISYLVVNDYLLSKSLSDEYELLSSPYLPSITIIAPAYNESVVVTDCVKSLLAVKYFNLEIIVVNDGSKDDTLERLISEFDMTPVEKESYHGIETKPVRGIYKSRRRSLTTLTVIDKENGRKADAINVGINYGWSDYYMVIDLDCILEPFALLRMVEPVLKSKKEVVAVGGVIGATNDSEISHGKFITAKAPKNFLPRMQIVEYIRAFLMSRPAWSTVNGLLIVSGALGLFERKSLVAVGGYSHDSIGEDMDLIIKLHKYCRDHKMNYAIEYVPFPLCWTEVPESKKILGSQRNRWMRGTIECMVRHRKMMFNPRYGVIGMVSYPFWFFGEMLAPFMEIGGLVLIFAFAMFGYIDVDYAMRLLIAVYIVSLFISFSSLALYYFSFRKYHRPEDLTQLFKSAMLEPILYHPRVLLWSMRGYKDYLFKKNVGWGMMTRTGLKKAAS